ncbi:hypothetical protein VTK26DRAFT_8837 [Humicola hyalothermophila]
MVAKDDITPAVAEDSQPSTPAAASPELPLPSAMAGREKRRRAGLLSYDELPDWYRDNVHIRHGYRPVSRSARASLASWLYVHNESVNIYSHLVPAAAFLLGEWYVHHLLCARYREPRRPVQTADHLVFAFFLLTAAVCLGLSAGYHTLLNHSQRIEALWLRLDLVGIVFLILGYFISGVYMIFWCESLQRTIYWSMIASLGAITVFILMSPWFRGPKWRTFRVMTFVTTGLTGFAPIAHGIQMFGFDQMVKQSGIAFYLAEGGLLALGALVYTTRFPESLAPGKFDIYGSSHQLFHILVVLATVIHLVAILEAFDYNYHHRTCQ